MGKHVKKSGKLGKILKIFLAALSIFIVVAAISAFIFLKYIEGRFHKSERDIKAIKRATSEPLPNRPINFLIIGCDKRENDKGRSDTLIVARVDPKKKKAVLISIPRDMRVIIPGKDRYDKINAAYAWGGPELSIRTVEEFTGLSINHYVEVDFEGFKKMVDALGGVEITVDEPIIDKSRKYRMYIPAGRQIFNGATALNYVRYRHDPKGDFGRIERQQKFIKALAEQTLRLSSVLKWPKLIEIFADNTLTDLSTSQMFTYVRLYRSMKPEDIEMVSLPGTPKMINGISYVVPDEEKIAEILERVKEGTSLKEFEKEVITSIPNRYIKVKVLNGCGVKGIAAKVKERLASLGFNVVGVGNASNYGYKVTKIVYNPTDYKKAVKVRKYFKGAVLEVGEDFGNSLDVIVIIGADYAKKDSD